jgi:hypothetical protein
VTADRAFAACRIHGDRRSTFMVDIGVFFQGGPDVVFATPDT